MTKEALLLPGFEPNPDRPWTVRNRSDGAALELADRHYNRKSRGSPWAGPPGRLLVLVTHDERALWITHYTKPNLAKDRLDGLRCSAFRNEGPTLSSDLIVAAMTLTLELWPERPPAGWLTYVDRSKVRSTNPGYCFLKAGWRRDPTFEAGPWARHLIRLRHDDHAPNAKKPAP